MAMPPEVYPRWSEKTISDRAHRQFDGSMRRLLTLTHATNDDGDPIPVDVPLSAEAKEAWIAFHDRNVGLQEEVDDDLAAAFSKLRGYAARLSLVVQLIR